MSVYIGFGLKILEEVERIKECGAVSFLLFQGCEHDVGENSCRINKAFLPRKAVSLEMKTQSGKLPEVNLGWDCGGPQSLCKDARKILARAQLPVSAHSAAAQLPSCTFLAAVLAQVFKRIYSVLDWVSVLTLLHGLFLSRISFLSWPASI